MNNKELLVPCTDCRGTGRQLTEVGRELIDLLRRPTVRLALKLDGEK
jgi:hypothetical protein